MRRALVASIAVLFACAPEPGALQPVVEAPLPAPASASALPPAPSAAPAVAAPAKPRLPTLPDGVDAAHFELLAGVCAAGLWRREDGQNFFGCRTPAPYDQPADLPDGEVIEGEFNEVCAVEEVYRGAFTAPGKEQAIVGLWSCDDERWNDISPGDALLLERGREGWALVELSKGTNVRGCKPVTRGERNLLLCRDGWGAYGDGSTAWHFTLDFTKKGKGHYRRVGTIYQDAGLRCMDGPRLEEVGLTDVETVSEKLADVNGDGLEDLTLVVRRGYAKPSKALAKRLEATCARGQGDEYSIDPTLLLGKPPPHTLTFLGVPDGFDPTPATKKLLDAWNADAPSGWQAPE